MAEGADEEEIQFLRTVSDAASFCFGLIKRNGLYMQKARLVYIQGQMRDSRTHLFGCVPYFSLRAE